MSEDIYFTPESKLGIIMRANVDVINAVSAMEHYEESLESMTILEQTKPRNYIRILKPVSIKQEGGDQWGRRQRLGLDHFPCRRCGQ